MKTKLFMTALALPLVFAACTNEDDFISAPGNQGETLTVAVTRGGFGADTKAAWVDEETGASFEWTSNASPNQDKIGMALLNPSNASKVLTNYEMSLVGWYNANGKGSAANYTTPADNGVKYTTTKPNDGNANAGVFQATGLTVMDGDYIVYHPYDADFAKAGYLAVDFRPNQTVAATTAASGATAVDKAEDAMLTAAGNNAFSYSQPTTIEKGGKVTSDFATTNLSALVKLALSKFPTSTNLEKVILLEDNANFDKNSKGFLKSAHLNASKITTQSGLNSLESPVYTSMIKFAFTDATAPGLTLKDNANIYLVAGPRTSTARYSILLIDDKNMASIWGANVKFEAGAKNTISIADDSKHPFETLIVTDGADLKNILETTTTYDNATINILGELTVEDLGDVKAKGVTVKAYNNNPETSLKFVAGSTNVSLSSATAATSAADGLKFEVPVTLASKGDNSMNLGGHVAMTEINNTGNLVLRGSNLSIKTVTNAEGATITFARQSSVNTTGNVTNNGTIILNGAKNSSGVETGATWKIAEGTTVTNNGTINNYFTVNNFGTIDNTKGTYVQKLEGKFIGQYDIAADKRGNYVIEVNSDEQFTYANGTTCTTIRIVNKEIGKTEVNSETKATIMTDLKVEKKIEMTGANAKLLLDDTDLEGGLYIINDGTTATISGTATASKIQINAASAQGAAAPKLTIEANSIIKAEAIVNNGQGSIKEGSTGIPADVKTLSSTGSGVWDNYPRVVTSL